MPAQISPDGRWWWDGTQWRSRLVEGELGLFWFTTTPDWTSRILLVGLIGLIPIVGAINLYGWTLVAVDMIRRGWRELPPANFSYLERGVAPFVTGLAYGFVILFALVGMAGSAIALGFSGSSRIPLAIGLGVLEALFLIALWVLGAFMFGALLIGSDRLGIGRALNPLRLFALARANHEVSVRIALSYFVASIAIFTVEVFISLVVPFVSLAVNLALPAVFAVLVPSLARFEVESAP